MKYGELHSVVLVKFLFQTGAIRSGLVAKGRTDLHAFLFQTGAIRSRITCVKPTTGLGVSIPNWCD